MNKKHKQKETQVISICKQN